MNRIYIDTKILLDRIIGSAPVKKDHKEILIKIKRRYKEIIVPQTVLGEIYAKLLEKSNNIAEHTNELTNVIKGLVDVKTQVPPLTKEILLKTIEMESRNQYHTYSIGYCFLVLIAHALCSCDCAVFMIDKAVHESEEIRNAISDCEHKVNLIESVEYY